LLKPTVDRFGGCSGFGNVYFQGDLVSQSLSDIIHSRMQSVINFEYVKAVITAGDKENGRLQ
jgi:hypothetical protein